jgi:hypothetical protein
MNTNIITIILLFFISRVACTSVSAQLHAVYIPEEKINRMKPDANPSDWNWVPDKYMIGPDKMVGTRENKKPDKNNFCSKIIVGWNDIRNKIYLFAVIHDDITNVELDNSRPYYSQDCIELAFCSLNSLDDFTDSYPTTYKNNVYKIHYMISTDHQEAFVFETGPKWLPQDNRFVKWGCSRKDKETIFELELSLWDYWDNKGSLFSRPCYLYSNKEIRFTIAFDDWDANENAVAQWATIPGRTWWTAFDDLSVFILDAPANSKVNYGRIESIIKSKKYNE